MSRRVVVITGASRGLGRELALRFGQAGDRVVVNYLQNRAAAEAVSDAVQAKGGDALMVQADVRAPNAVNRMFATVTETWGDVSVLINNAGRIDDQPLVRMDERSWDDVIAGHLHGSFYCIRAAARSMTRNREGHIINIASIAGIQGRTGQANYAAAKAGLIALTKAAARELGGSNIQVNAVLPGFMETEMTSSIPADVRERVRSDNVLGRLSDPREVADFILHLASMRNISGQVLNLDSRVL